ncbi:LysM peptidoglycan-binding domain-containing protein [Alteromonas aestuariivivens]|uniref:LysM peptidoglycan-binding domain-containing protein n=1 Tax=Alteromonas aestuariivivens TaxID=1938339 RepID=A0A3D8M426_9ALTE|nr:LysM peptidoglycan-binding domain-containing protein [Alteromonas aestuariivivens]RDV24305.1 LysM peptidoglycan-binding domain-containing protein [Alteromonas aestuariivivens]
MKSQLSILSMLAVALTLVGCQLNKAEQQAEQAVQDTHSNLDRLHCSQASANIESPQDCAIAQEGVIEVIHPAEDVSVDLPAESSNDESELINDVWLRVANQMTFAIPADKRIEVQRNWYLKHPEYMARVVSRAKPFLFYIVNEIEARDMPLELVLLPIVESAFDPFAYSHGRAAGMWQFIPGTAERFGMRQTWWYDGRRDVIASTQGALDYLTYLRDYFDGNWLHALAAYNSGEGRVKRAIKANAKAGKPTDFWSLDLPRETRAYVPKLLALADILKNKDSYDYDWPSVDNVAVIETVDIDSQVDLAFAAQLAGMSLKDLHALNPGFNRWATDPDGPHRLILPMDKASQFKQELANVDRSERLNWVRHKVERGDSLLKLAKEYHTTADIIKRVNSMDSNMIRVGDHIMVPVALQELDSYSLSADQRLASTQSTKRADHKITHTVVSGDTLWDISRKYKVSTQSLARWNGMAPKDPLRAGKKLVVWLDKVSKNQKQDAILRTLTYTVRNGDSLSRIADKFNLSVSDITKWNAVSKKSYLQPGQKLKLYVDVTRLKNVG